MVRFDPVTERADAILIVGSGPSAAPLTTLHVPGHVHIIAVKTAVFGLPRSDSWMTVDCNNRTRKFMLGRRRAGVQYYAAVPENYGTVDATREAHRGPAEPNVHWLNRICELPIGTYGLAKDPCTIHSGNSAYGALGLAYHMMPRRIGIVGVDLDGANYVWRGPAPHRRPHGDMSHVPKLFESALTDLQDREIEVRSASGPLLTAFPRVTVQELVQWLAAV